MLIFIGILCILAGGALLSEVPFLRFISAISLFSVGQVLLVLGAK